MCNENGNCHCNAGWKCPDCLEAYDGLGGSIDSGFNCEPVATKTTEATTIEATTTEETTTEATTTETTATEATTTEATTTKATTTVGTTTETTDKACGNGFLEDGEQCDCGTQEVTETRLN